MTGESSHERRWGAGRALRFDYTTVGHVTIDVLEDGSRRAGGAAFYSALQAARLGLRTLIVTRGVAAEIEALLEPFAGELELRVDAAKETTTLATSGSGVAREQRVLAWAGRMPDGLDLDLDLDTAILHLAPVARETPARWRGDAAFLGLTPQGLVRRWSGPGGRVSLAAPAAAPATSPAPRRAAGEGDGEPSAELLALASRCDAIVVSEQERASCAGMIAAAVAGGGVVAVTDGAAPTTVIEAGATLELEVPPVAAPLDDLGAGDVFAAAFFIALADGSGLREAAVLAKAAAAVRMQGYGAGAIGHRAAIEERAAAGPPT
jgi:1D-myo-inositol 3-kinase